MFPTQTTVVHPGRRVRLYQETDPRTGIGLPKGFEVVIKSIRCAGPEVKVEVSFVIANERHSLWLPTSHLSH